MRHYDIIFVVTVLILMSLGTPPLAAKDGEAAARVADASTHLDDGRFSDALTLARAALKLDPHLGSAHFSAALALASGGSAELAFEQLDAAFADPDLTHQAGSRGATMGLYVRLLMEAGDFIRAEDFLNVRSPGIRQLLSAPAVQDFGDLGVPPHLVIAMAHLYALTNRPGAAAKLYGQLTFVKPEYLTAGEDRPLEGFEHWNLAATGIGRISDEAVLDHLEAAVDAGFTTRWRFNFARHQTLWPLRHHPRMRALLDRLSVLTAAERE